MSKPIIRIHNIETDEIIDREMNEQEFVEWQLDQAKILAEAEAKAEAESKRLILLDKLGITEDEAKLLLG